MFHYDDGLKLTRSGLAIDFRRRQPLGFISHAHTDHMGPHALAFCTPETARFYQLRLGPRRICETPYRTPVELGATRLTTFPAGHCLGSAMLLAEEGGASLLYTGDFKLRSSATCEDAEPPRADVLVMECTFGHPSMRMPPREQTARRLVALVQQALEQDRTPIIHAYALGKAQEVSRILTDSGVCVAQTREAYAISQIYEELGVSLGDVRPLGEEIPRGVAIVTPPGANHPILTARIDSGQAVTIAVTGWALDPRTNARWRVDHAVPISDHADYDELLEAVDRIRPRQVFCTHGPDVEGFVNRLRELGWDAFSLGRRAQLRLF